MNKDYFGSCGRCGYLNVGRNHWGVCTKNKTFWAIGSNLFSSWKEQTEEEWERNIKELSEYTEISIQDAEKQDCS